MKEIITKKQLPNGVTAILAPNSATKAVTVLVLFGTGSRYEPANLGGISHFLEHMYFKGTKKRPTALKIAEELDTMGSIYNAFTGKEYTGYFIKAASDHLEQIFDILSDILFNPLFDAKELEKEKGAVVQEINMYEDSPREYVDDLYELNLYGENHPLGRLIAGTREKVRAVTRADLVNYLKTHYFGANAIVSVAGDINEAKTYKFIQEYFGKMPRGVVKAPQKFLKPVPTTPLIHFKETEQTNLILGVHGYSYSDPKKISYKLLASILGGGMSSRLFIEIREKRGLAYFVRSGTSEYMDTGTFATQTGVENDKVYEAVKLIVAEYKNAPKSITQNELAKAKEMTRGRWILDYEDSMSVAMKLGMDQRYGEKLLTLDQRIEKLDAVTLEQVKNSAAEVFSRPLSFALIGPFKDKEKFAKLLK